MKRWSTLDASLCWAKSMRREDQTDLGGIGESFLTTHWSLIEAVKKGHDKDKALIGLLLERYWKPVYCYLRRKGHGNEEAKDLTQSFFHEIVLNRRLVERADASKGRFRSFLLHALDQFLIDQMRRGSTQSRIPAEKLVPLDITDPPENGKNGREAYMLILRCSTNIFINHTPNIPAIPTTAIFRPLGPVNGINIPPKRVPIKPSTGQRNKMTAATATK